MIQYTFLTFLLDLVLCVPFSLRLLPEAEILPTSTA